MGLEEFKNDWLRGQRQKLWEMAKITQADLKGQPSPVKLNKLAYKQVLDFYTNEEELKFVDLDTFKQIRGR